MARPVLYVQMVGCEGPGLIEWTRPESLPCAICRPVLGHPIPPDAAGYSAVIVLGGPMGVYEREKYPWLTDLFRLLSRAVECGVPVLGICLGSQALAVALGAEVRPSGVQEMGWLPIRLLESAEFDPLLRGLPKELPAFHWHGDRWELPDEAVLLARSEMCDHQVFRMGDKAWGFQFHLEVTGETPLIWAEAYAADLSGECGVPTPLGMVAETQRNHPVLEPYARRIFNRFWEVVLSSPQCEGAHD